MSIFQHMKLVTLHLCTPLAKMENGVQSGSFTIFLLGSSRLLIQKGLTESLAGRLETLYLEPIKKLLSVPSLKTLIDTATGVLFPVCSHFNLVPMFKI